MIACLRIPFFAATVHRFEEASQETMPLLVTRYSGGRGRVVGLSPEAASAGVEIGMTVSRARALCPTAQVSLFSPTRLRHTIEDLQMALLRYSQWNDVERSGVQTAIVYLDLGKLRPREGREMAAAIASQLRGLGFPVETGLASGKFTARVAAEQAAVDDVVLVGRGDEAAFLASHPVTLLPLDADTARRLSLFGLCQMGQLAQLPRSALIAQFGKLGERLHRLVSGEDVRRVARYTPPATETAARDFDPPLDNHLILDTCLADCAARLMTTLIEQRLTCREITLTLTLDNHMELDAQAHPREPIGQLTGLKQVLQRLSQKLTITTGVVHLEIRLGRLAPVRPRQLSLFDTLEAPDLRAVLLDLSERYGESLFYSISVNPLDPSLPEWRFLFETIEAA